MKEYVAETGGRYTYADDILNLQELALSMTSIFDGCSNFIIAGCEYAGNDISSGYVWINKKVRYFAGHKNATSPYFIYEKNTSETVTYANEANKKGRDLYLCTGGSNVPEVIDPVTGKVPQYIEMNIAYSPRFIDRFFGEYAVLSDSPFAKQTIKKDLLLVGNFTADKNIESKTAVSVTNPQNGYSIKNIIKTNGDASTGVYLNGLLINEVVIHTDGSFSYIKGDKELARITENGISYSHGTGKSAKFGSIYLSGNSIINSDDSTDNGTVNINSSGLENNTSKFRNFNVYDGKQGITPLFQVNGKEKTININGNLKLRNNGDGILLYNTAYLKDNPLLTNCYIWTDSQGDKIGNVGYADTASFDFSIHNLLGNITLTPNGSVNITGVLKIGGINIADIYVTQQSFTSELKNKVSVVAGKQLSAEDFTTAYKKKLDAISGSSIESANDGFVTSKDISAALKLKMTLAENLKDLPDKGVARSNLEVYSKNECNGRFLRISEKLTELITLTADEINGLTADQAAALKAQKQEAIRLNIDAEKKGASESKLTKTSNLSDLSDKAVARKNISVYSAKEIDDMMAGKLGTDGAYQGSVFTSELKSKLEKIKSGSFAYIDSDNISHAEVEGYVPTSQVKKELAKKANRLLDGYNDNEKRQVAENIGIYIKSDSDIKYANISSLFQDYITYLVKQGKTSSEAQKTLRDKLDVLSKQETADNYIRKDSKLSDLSLPNADAKKQVCQKLGAAYADEYQPKLIDTGWIRMSNSGGGTDTSRLYIRQIGNLVSIQGVLNTARRDGSNWGGVVAIIPNQIMPPAHGIRNTLADWNDDTKYNRGASFIIRGGSRSIQIYESGFYNVDTEMNFTYMT